MTRHKARPEETPAEQPPSPMVALGQFLQACGALLFAIGLLVLMIGVAAFGITMCQAASK